MSEDEWGIVVCFDGCQIGCRPIDTNRVNCFHNKKKCWRFIFLMIKPQLWYKCVFVCVCGGNNVVQYIGSVVTYTNDDLVSMFG